jgi:protein phosphatase-4 regulatory subunit 3
VLARALDDSTFNVLSSCIIFNQIDIITHVQMEPTFLRDIVRLFVDEGVLGGGGRRAGQEGEGGMDMDSNPDEQAESPLLNGNHGRISRTGSYAFAPPDDLSEEDIALRREVVLLIQHLCTMGKNAQLATRLTLFRTLVDRGILFAVQWALGLPERDEESKVIISNAGEILSALLDHDVIGVRGHVLKQVVAIEKERLAGKRGADKAETILVLVCRMMANSRDLAVQSQTGDALKALLEVPPDDGFNVHVYPALPRFSFF